VRPLLLVLVLLCVVTACSTDAPAPSEQPSGAVGGEGTSALTPETTTPEEAPTAVTPPSTVPETSLPTTTLASNEDTDEEVPAETDITPLDATEPGVYDDPVIRVALRIESLVSDVTSAELENAVLSTLNDPRSWSQSGFEFISDPDSDLAVILAEGSKVDALCSPLKTRGTLSCQNGAIIALNADRWRTATADWDGTIAGYRTYLVNHEVGHLIGLRHPSNRCPADGDPAAVMDPQTLGLNGCVGNGWPLQWEIEWASRRPSTIGPLPDWDGPHPEWLPISEYAPVDSPSQ
jgi:hypothetical protein